MAGRAPGDPDRGHGAAAARRGAAPRSRDRTDHGDDDARFRFTLAEGLGLSGTLVDVDHMSVLAGVAALDQLEAAGYSGVVSSHRWSSPEAAGGSWPGVGS